MKNESVVVLVVSCSAYQDLWRPFFTLFFRYWPDCPYQVYLLTNRGVYNDARIKIITVEGDDRDWSPRLIKGLQRLGETSVLFLLEDYLLVQPVDTARIQDLASYMEEQQAACLRLFPSPGPDVPCGDNPDVGMIRKETRYRLSTQAAIWDRKILLQLLREDEDIWQLERKGSRRTNSLEAPFLSVYRNSSRPLPYFCTAVVKGKWVRKAVKLCEEENIPVDLNVRPQETRWDRFRDTRVYSCYRIPAQYIAGLLHAHR